MEPVVDLEANKRVLLGMMERVVGRGDWDNAMNHFTEDFVAHGTGPVPTDVEGLKAMTIAWRTAFPDWRDDLEDIVAERDLVVLRLRASGTHLGPLAGIPATGEKVKWGMIEIIRVRDGKVAEQWGYSDFADVLKRLRRIAEKRNG